MITPTAKVMNPVRKTVADIINNISMREYPNIINLLNAIRMDIASVVPKVARYIPSYIYSSLPL